MTGNAAARRGDPDTSHAAANSVADLRTSQQAVWRLLHRLGPRTDEELVHAYCERYLPDPMQTPQGVRSRRAELARQGLVRDTGQRRPTNTGRMARVWEAV